VLGVRRDASMYQKKRKENSQDEPLSVLLSSLKLPTQLHHVIGTALHTWDKNLSEWSLIMSCQCNVRGGGEGA
jgi:hypothetical protein